MRTAPVGEAVSEVKHQFEELIDNERIPRYETSPQLRKRS